MTEPSPKFRLSSEDIQKIGKGALVALAGAAIVFLTQTIPGVDFGRYTPLVVAGSAIAVNALWKFLQGQQPLPPPSTGDK